MSQRIQKMNESTQIAWPLAKVLSVWAAFGITTWQEAAAFAAFLYSMCLIIEWIYKKVWVGMMGRGNGQRQR